MKKIFIYCLFGLTAGLASCADDEKDELALKLVVDGKSIKIKNPRATLLIRDHEDYGIEKLVIQGDFGKLNLFVLTVYEVGLYDENKSLIGGGLRPRTYWMSYTSPPNEEDCVEHGAFSHCDEFTIYLSEPTGPGMALENVNGQLELTSYDIEKMKAIGTFSVTGNEVAGSSFSITGKFNLNFKNSTNP